MRKALALVLGAVLIAAACSNSARDPDEQTIVVLGPFLDSSADAFSDSMAAFTARTGIRIDYVGSSDLRNDINTALSTGGAPDVAVIPQPGFIAELAERTNGVLPLPDDVAESVAANYNEEAQGIGEIDGTLFGVVYKISPKSLVWYAPAFFEANDLEIPESLDDLVDLVAGLEEEVSPWCFTMYAFAATGWIVTDWIEDLLLRQAGPEAYDDWVAGDLDFDSAEVRLAMETFDGLVIAGDRAYGGAARYLRNVVQDAQRPMFDDPLNCALHRQAGFAENWLPSGVAPGADGDTDVFLMPPVDVTDETRLLVGGDTAVMFNDSPEIREFMSYLATPESGAVWAAGGGYTGAHSTVADAEAYYPDPFDRRLAGLVAGADVLRFDGSDMMPDSFAGTALLETLTAWVSGQIDLDTAVEILDEERKEIAAS